MTFGVVEEPFKVTVGLLQPIFPETEAPAFGAKLSNATIAFAVVEQPLIVFVTITLYVPETVTVGEASVEVKPFGPFHK